MKPDVCDKRQNPRNRARWEEETAGQERQLHGNLPAENRSKQRRLLLTRVFFGRMVHNATDGHTDKKEGFSFFFIRAEYPHYDGTDELRYAHCSGRPRGLSCLDKGVPEINWKEFAREKTYNFEKEAKSTNLNHLARPKTCLRSFECDRYKSSSESCPSPRDQTPDVRPRRRA